MKKLLKSGIYGSMNSTLIHCLLQKSQHLRLLFNEQYINSNRVTPKCMEKKKGTKTKFVKRKRGFSGSKHTLYIYIYIYSKIVSRKNVSLRSH